MVRYGLGPVPIDPFPGIVMAGVVLAIS